jgi:hypothetical protein
MDIIMGVLLEKGTATFWEYLSSIPVFGGVCFDNLFSFMWYKLILESHVILHVFWLV